MRGVPITHVGSGHRHDVWQRAHPALTYDKAGNVTGDGSQLTYDATGQQTRALYTGTGGWDIQQAYDGDRQRVKKVEGGQATYYLRSTVLGGQVVAEYNQAGAWTRGYVYDGGGQLLATQQSGTVWWVHTDPVTKSKRVTDRQGAFVSSVDVDPWGGETSRMENGGALSQKFTTYERDGNGRDQAMMRSYHAWFSRFDQPDPFDGSYDLTDPQSFNRYAYVHNDPINFTDPSGLDKSGIEIGADGKGFSIYEWVTVYGTTSGGLLGGGIRPRPMLPLDPQKTLVSSEELKFFRNRIDETLKNPKCQAFLKALFDEVKAKTGESPTDILTSFDQTKFYWENTSPYGGSAYVENGRPAASIHNAFKTESFISNGRSAFLISQTTQSFLGETLHNVGHSYSDGVMANALNAILVGKGLDKPQVFSDKTEMEVQRASVYWHPKVWAACPTPQK